MGTGIHCNGCSLEKIGTGFTQVEIGALYGQTRLLVIGEASGEAEARDSSPFRPYAQSGSLLSQALRETNISRSEIAITNVLRCRPPKDWLEGAPWQYSATQQCLTNYLADVIKELKPNVILALGGTAFRALTVPIKGRSGTLDYIRGYALPGGGVAEGVPVVATYHPAFLRRGASHLTPLLQRDIRRAFLIATGKLMEGQHYVLDPLKWKGRYQTAPTITEAWEWFRTIGPNRSIYADIETPRSRREDEDDRNSFADRDINLVQFTQRRGSGIALPYRDEYVAVIRAILATDNRKVGHNWFGFDLPVLTANDIVVNGEQDDTMLQFHHYHADLPQNLQAVAQFCGFPFAWKHLSESEQELYGCLTAESRVMMADGSARRIEDIVKNQSIDPVMGMDEEGNPISVPVVAWRRIQVKGQAWKKIKVEGVDQPLFLTPDHKVWANSHWVEAGKLKVGDLIPVHTYGSDDLIHGSLLGDGSVDSRGRFKIAHCQAQTAYFEAKRKALNGPTYLRDREKYGEWRTTEVWISVTRWRVPFYAKGNRQRFVPPSDAALAIWYMDDGCLANGNYPRIACQKENTDEAWTWLEEKFGRVSLYSDNRAIQGGSFGFTKESKIKFLDCIAPFVHPSMAYKLPEKWHGQYNGWLEKMQHQTSVVASVEDYDPGSRNRDWRYCITVDHPTHRFFAMGGLVKNCLDVDATCWADETMHTLLERDGLLPSYKRYVQQFWPILRDMANRGLPVSDERRLALKGVIAEENIRADATIKGMVPAEVLAQKQKNGYKNPPILKCEDCDYEGRGDHFCNGPISDGGDDPTSLDNNVGSIQVRPVLYSELAEQNGLVLREVTIKEEEKCRCTKKNRSGCNVCAGAGIIPAGLVEWRWAALTEFNPNSSHQVKRFMRFMKHPVPKHAKRTDSATGEASDTTEVKELERLSVKTKHPIYPLLIEKRQLTKIEGTYVEGWRPGRDGRIHTTFTFKPATWQNSSREPNTQNGLKHGKTEFQKRLAKSFNGMQCAEPGHVMVNVDAKSFHAQTTACEFGLPDYLRLAKIDIHSFVTCHYLKLPERIGLLERPDEEMRDIFKFLKKGEKFKFCRDYKAKRTILGIQFAMFHRKLYQLNPDDFENAAEAQKLWELIMVDLFPGLKKGQDAARAEAAEQKYLMSKYGAVRRFYDVQRWDGRQQRFVGGDQAEAAVAFKPAANAFGYMREFMIRMRDKGWDEKYQLVNSIHDSIVLHCPKELVEECTWNMTTEMAIPSTVLVYPKCAPFGLSVEAEASVGPDLAHMEEIK